MTYNTGNENDQINHVRRLIESNQLDELVDNMHHFTKVEPDYIVVMLCMAGHGDFVDQHADKFDGSPLTIRTPDGLITSTTGAPESPGAISRLPTERFDV